MPSRTHIALFFLVNLALCSWHLDTGTNDSIISRAALTAAIVEHGTVCIDAYHDGLGDKALVNGHYFSDKAPLPSLILVPIWWTAYHAGVVSPGKRGLLTESLLATGGFLFGSVPLAIIISLLWWHGRRNGWSARWGFPLTIALPLFGSFLFVYSGTLYNHVPAALFLLLSSLAIADERPVAAGLWASAAVLTDTALAILVAVHGFQFLFFHGWRKTIRFGTALLPAILGLLAWNNLVTGSPLSFTAAYAANYPQMHEAYGFGASFFAAAPGLLFSTYRGLFFFMPVLFSIVFVQWRPGLRGLLSDPWVMPSVVFIAAYCTHATWWGGWAYGPRYLAAPGLLLFVFTLHHLRTQRWAAFALILTGAIGCLFSFSAKSTLWYSMPTEFHNPIRDLVLPAIKEGRFTTAQWPVWLGMDPGVASMCFLLLFAISMVALVRIDRTSPISSN